MLNIVKGGNNGKRYNNLNNNILENLPEYLKIKHTLLPDIDTLYTALVKHITSKRIDPDYFTDAAYEIYGVRLDNLLEIVNVQNTIFVQTFISDRKFNNVTLLFDTVNSEHFRKKECTLKDIVSEIIQEFTAPIPEDYEFDVCITENDDLLIRVLADLKSRSRYRSRMDTYVIIRELIFEESLPMVCDYLDEECEPNFVLSQIQKFTKNLGGRMLENINSHESDLPANLETDTKKIQNLIRFLFNGSNGKTDIAFKL